MEILKFHWRLLETFVKKLNSRQNFFQPRSLLRLFGFSMSSAFASHLNVRFTYTAPEVPSTAWGEPSRMCTAEKIEVSTRLLHFSKTSRVNFSVLNNPEAWRRIRLPRFRIHEAFSSFFQEPWRNCRGTSTSTENKSFVSSPTASSSSFISSCHNNFCFAVVVVSASLLGWKINTRRWLCTFKARCYLFLFLLEPTPPSPLLIHGELSDFQR